MDFFRETTSGFMSVFSASFVRQWIHVSSSLQKLLYSDRAIDSRPALLSCVSHTRVDGGIGMFGLVLLVSTHFALFFSFVTVYSALLGPQWHMLCVSPRSGRILCFST